MASEVSVGWLSGVSVIRVELTPAGIEAVRPDPLPLHRIKTGTGVRTMYVAQLQHFVGDRTRCAVSQSLR